MNNDVKAVFLLFFPEAFIIITAGVLWQALCACRSTDFMNIVYEDLLPFYIVLLDIL